MNKNIKYSQNFLTSEKVLNQIIKQLNLKETDTVYEIGTGKGHLTTKLAKISKQVTSIELDSHLFNLSSEKLKLNTRVTLIHQDRLPCCGCQARPSSHGFARPPPWMQGNEHPDLALPLQHLLTGFRVFCRRDMLRFGFQISQHRRTL